MMLSKRNLKNTDLDFVCLQIFLGHHLWLDIATGLSDALVHLILERASTITEPSDLLALGVCSAEQAEAIMQIIHSCLK